MTELVVFAGLPSNGKSSVIKWLIERIAATDSMPAYVRLHCHPASREVALVPPERELTLVSGRVCPDHFLAAEIPHVLKWAEPRSDWLLIETAGLCARCSPFPRAAMSVFVADLTMGCAAIRRVGPMLTTCDLCVLTRADRASSAETAMAMVTARRVNPNATILLFNGLTGEGSSELWVQLCRQQNRPKAADVHDTLELRARAPQFNCSYCMGQRRVAVFES